MATLNSRGIDIDKELTNQGKQQIPGNVHISNQAYRNSSHDINSSSAVAINEGASSHTNNVIRPTSKNSTDPLQIASQANMLETALLRDILARPPSGINAASVYALQDRSISTRPNLDFSGIDVGSMIRSNQTINPDLYSSLSRASRNVMHQRMQTNFIDEAVLNRSIEERWQMERLNSYARPTPQNLPTYLPNSGPQTRLNQTHSLLTCDNALSPGLSLPMLNTNPMFLNSGQSSVSPITQTSLLALLQTQQNAATGTQRMPPVNQASMYSQSELDQIMDLYLLQQQQHRQQNRDQNR